MYNFVFVLLHHQESEIKLNERIFQGNIKDSFIQGCIVLLTREWGRTSFQVYCRGVIERKRHSDSHMLRNSRRFWELLLINIWQNGEAVMLHNFCYVCLALISFLLNYPETCVRVKQRLWLTFQCEQFAIFFYQHRRILASVNSCNKS